LDFFHSNKFPDYGFNAHFQEHGLDMRFIPAAVDISTNCAKFFTSPQFGPSGVSDGQTLPH